MYALRKIHRNTPGKLKGIYLAPEEEESLGQQQASEVFLVKMSKFLEIEIQQEDEKPFRYKLPAEYVVWSRDPKGSAKV